MSVNHEVFNIPRLLRIPTKRAAWSDRTALLMAEMSKIAYYKFELDADGNSLPQTDLDDVWARLIAPADEAVDVPSGDSEDEDKPPELPEGAIRLRDDLVTSRQVV